MLFLLMLVRSCPTIWMSVLTNPNANSVILMYTTLPSALILLVLFDNAYPADSKIRDAHQASHWEYSRDPSWSPLFASIYPLSSRQRMFRKLSRRFVMLPTSAIRVLRMNVIAILRERSMLLWDNWRICLQVENWSNMYAWASILFIECRAI